MMCQFTMRAKDKMRKGKRTKPKHALSVSRSFDLKVKVKALAPFAMSWMLKHERIHPREQAMKRTMS